eukprot:scaffold162568_cov33-Tisochrysis_lutea.AAC.1
MSPLSLGHKDTSKYQLGEQPSSSKQSNVLMCSRPLCQSVGPGGVIQQTQHKEARERVFATRPVLASTRVGTHPTRHGAEAQYLAAHGGKPKKFSGPLSSTLALRVRLRVFSASPAHRELLKIQRAALAT